MTEEHSKESSSVTPMHIEGERLVSYLYGESEPAERAFVTAHLDVCGFCAEEIAALGATRDHLAAWRPPDAILGFQMSRGDAPAETSRETSQETLPARVLRPQRWWASPLPAWAQVAAALLIFGAGLSIGGARVGIPGASRAEETSASRADEAVPRPVPAADRVPVSADGSPDLAREIQSLRAELAAVRSVSSTVPGRQDPALMRQVQSLIAESEHRQRNEFTLRAAQLLSDLDAQMRGDLTRINQRVTSVEGTTNGLAREVSATSTQPLVTAPR
jgi:hypothetical protein